ncbi:N-acetyl-alpha-D-glucosaminyl L-malate synthase BshA [Sporosarcina sp. 179-K 3D1 HS]|uniref:N-acetyl-alpha-D-glucosaminyl L-malate synthase BshA n=1 Tax=Sporosarcina sp. 179-K 3D1 HS TaxID=3232169 RepID=UPI0039A326AE
MNKLKVGVICYPSLGGSGVVATELGQKMTERGHEMHFISSGRPFRLTEENPRIIFHEVKIDDYAVFQYPPYDIALANEIAQVIEEEKLDLLHVHYAVPHAISASLGKDMAQSDIGIITTLHGTDVTILGHDPGLRNTVRYGINKSDRTTAVSEFLAQETMELIRPDRPIMRIHNFIDENRYRPVEPGLLKEELGIRQEERVMIHISNFRKVKRIPDIIMSFQKVVEKMPDVKLLLVGEGPEKPDMEQLVLDLHLESHVIFTGKRNDLPELLAISDVMFQMSEKEAFGLVLLEALACGVPSIATDIGGIPEVIEDGVNGFLVPLGDCEEAAAKAVTLLQDDALLDTFKRHALAIANEKFDTETIVSQYESLYYEVVGRT